MSTQDKGLRKGGLGLKQAHFGGKPPLAVSVKPAAADCVGASVCEQDSLSSYKLSVKARQIQNHTATFLEVKVIIYLEM